MARILLTNALTIAMPTGTVRLCDGGLVDWDGDIYTARDAVWGVITDVGSLSEGVGDEIPGFQITMTPHPDTDFTTLHDPAVRGVSVQAHVLELDDNHAVTDAELMFDGMVAGCSIKSGRGERSVTLAIVSRAEWLFQTENGNRLDPTFHKSIFPGELGEDNATGLSVAVAWGAPTPAVSGVASAGKSTFFLD